MESRLADLEEQRSVLRAHWLAEKELVKTIQEIKEQTEQLKIEADRAQRTGDYERAARIQYGEQLELDGRIEEKNRALAELQRERRMLKEEVDEEDHRPGCLEVDGHPGEPPGRGRGREVGPDGIPLAPAGGGPG